MEGRADEVHSQTSWREAFSRLRTRKAQERTRSFWLEVFTLQDSVTVQVTRRVLMFAAFSLLVCGVNDLIEHIDLGIEVAPYEVAGAALGLLLVLRTNAGYERWWEGRRLWGAIVNETRNLAMTALAHGPDDPDWRDRAVLLTAAFAHACRRSLRGQREIPEVVALVGHDEAERIVAAGHMPGYVALRIAEVLREGCERHGMDRFAFLQAEQMRSMLIDHVGGCERILKTPLPRAYSINIRRFIALFLGTLPFALLPKVGWLTPLVTLLVAYPILSLDDIGVELQNPFDARNQDHLPLDAICTTIEHDLRSLLAESGRA
jgi:ion channel-forming bestrophin family protein